MNFFILATLDAVMRQHPGCSVVIQPAAQAGELHLIHDGTDIYVLGVGTFDERDMGEITKWLMRLHREG